MNNLKKSVIATVVVVLVTVLVAFSVQIVGQSKVTPGCSYLDPPTVDILAFLVAVFLVIEGIVRIAEHPTASLKRQSTRMIRIAIGAAIITLHVMQVIHK